MPLRLFSLTLLAALCLLGMAAMSVAAAPKATNTILYDQMDGAGGSTDSVSSDNITGSGSRFSSFAADDFVVPDGQTWYVDQVEVTGRYTFTPTAASVNVYFFTDNAGLPNTQMTTWTVTPSSGADSGSFVLHNDTPAQLASGHYWVSVQANVENGVWEWNNRTTQSNSPAAWMNPPGGYTQINCQNWKRRQADCGWGSGPDQLFRLSGETTPPTVTGTTTSTTTGTPTITGTPAPPTPTVAPGCLFSDVCPSNYWFVPVASLLKRGAISGYSDNTFRPFNNTTRGQLAKIVVVATGLTDNGGITPLFSDVPPNNPFYEQIKIAAQHQLISGYADGTFKPFADVTRGQLAKVVVLARGWQLVNPTTPSFVDVATTNPFYKEIETAVAHGIISGYADSTYRWGANAIRAQISKVVYQAISGGDATVTPVPGATFTPTMTPQATLTPTVTATPALTSCAGSGSGYHAGARVSNATPTQNSDVTVTGLLCHDNTVVQGAIMAATWQFQSSNPTCNGTTNENGEASCTQNVGTAPVNVQVTINLSFKILDVQVATAQTSITPR